MFTRLLTAALLLAPPALADAEVADAEVSEESALRYGFGARIGGYGFREVTDGSTSWEDCRMDGLGLFTTLDLSDHLFGEVSLDYYQAHASVVDHGMDRESGHLMASVGARMFPDFFLSPYIQAGAGAEWTRIKLSATQAEREDVLPAGFLGVGAELNITEHLKVGTNVRMFLMGHPLHGSATDTGAQAGAHGSSHHALTSDDEKVPLEYGAAGQLQFFLRYAM